MTRVYDSGVVLREDIFLGVRHLEAEIAALQTSMEKLKEEAAAREGRIEGLKRELGITDVAEPGEDDPDYE